MSYLYHLLMYHWCGFRIWLAIRGLRFWGWVYGLPVLTQYSDRAIVQGMVKLHLEKSSETN